MVTICQPSHRPRLFDPMAYCYAFVYTVKSTAVAVDVKYRQLGGS